MEEESDIYYVDTRNADPQNRRIMGFPVGGRRIGGAQPSSSTRTVYVPHGTRSPMQYGQPSYGQPQVIYAHPPSGGFGVGSLFGNLTTGQVIDMVAQIFAMLQPLPAAPAVTTDAPTDVGNSILYQTALAQYAKRDEQVRTIGSLVSKLVG